MNQAVILIVEDDPLQRRLVRENLEGEGFIVNDAADGKAAVEQMRRLPADVAVVDFKLGGESGIDVIRLLLKENPALVPVMATAFASVETAVEAIKAGAYDYIVKPIDFKKLLLIIDRALERHRLQAEVRTLRETLADKFSARNFIFASPAMEAVSRLMAKAAESDANVLITGETGTGKDLVARSIHFASRRAKGPFLAVNIPSLPESLIESELFGAEKGAFTGAGERKIGKFEAAGGGTLLLDEIGDLPVHLQVKILRFLQDREFSRLGGTAVLRSDVRIIAATNRDLERAVAEGSFRADLYYRLDVIRIALPPLRERKEDIPPLIDHFLRKYAAREKKDIRGLSAEALALLTGHRFPGNVRELENAVERAAVFCDGDTIRTEDLPRSLTVRPETDLPSGSDSLEDKVRRLETREILDALQASGGVKSKAARLLGITERMLSYKVKIYGLASKTQGSAASE
ncbi:MAG: sigma-54-dependent Fis family transcriptional regulator [Candidatus Aminicenantes bacterium]|nr:sigma-54-dependent Fis family transcriptional regulator [Candidatus Aminicenantes bacterium]